MRHSLPLKQGDESSGKRGGQASNYHGGGGTSSKGQYTKSRNYDKEEIDEAENDYEMENIPSSKKWDEIAFQKRVYSEHYDNTSGGNFVASSGRKRNG